MQNLSAFKRKILLLSIWVFREITMAIIHEIATGILIRIKALIPSEEYSKNCVVV